MITNEKVLELWNSSQNPAVLFAFAQSAGVETKLLASVFCKLSRLVLPGRMPDPDNRLHNLVTAVEEWTEGRLTIEEVYAAIQSAKQIHYDAFAVDQQNDNGVNSFEAACAAADPVFNLLIQAKADPAVCVNIIRSMITNDVIMQRLLLMRDETSAT